jgi:hypothetical protein
MQFVSVHCYGFNPLLVVHARLLGGESELHREVRLDTRVPWLGH